MSTLAEPHAGRRQGGLCRGGGSGDRTPTRVRPPHVSPPPMPRPWDAAHRETRKDARLSGHRLAVDATGHGLLWRSGSPLHGAAPLPLPGERLWHEEKMRIMRVVLLLLMATCLTGASRGFRFTARMLRRPSVICSAAPSLPHGTSPPAPARRSVGRARGRTLRLSAPTALGAPRHTDASVTACVLQARRARDA